MNNLLNASIIKELDGIVTKIKNKIDVNKIILFGSYAYGTPTSGSNIQNINTFN